MKSVYVAVCCGSVILVLVAFVWASGRSSVSRTWRPLVPVVNGTFDRTYGSAVLRGTYQELPILATQIPGGAENPDTLRIEMTTFSRGANWLVHYASEKLFGMHHWHLQAGHKKLSQRLTDLDVLNEQVNGLSRRATA